MSQHTMANDAQLGADRNNEMTTLARVPTSSPTPMMASARQLLVEWRTLVPVKIAITGIDVVIEPAALPDRHKRGGMGSR
jgi:hypothetical protein